MKQADTEVGQLQFTRALSKKKKKKKEAQHSDAWDRCVKKVSAKGGVDNAYAVCTASVGESDRKAQTQSVRLLEEDKDTNRFRVVLIREGMGNLHDGYYYSRGALQSAVKLFEGKKIYADHPSAEEEKEHPERSVNEIIGYFENCVFSVAEDGRGQIEADVVILKGEGFDRYRSLMQEAVNFSTKHPDLELVGLSINASGAADEMSIDDLQKSVTIPIGAKDKIQEAVSQGIETIRYVKEITDAFSCDLVTNPGAGGKVLKLLERGKKPMKANQVKEADQTEHEDADQDKELIMKILKDLGVEDDDEDGEHEEEEGHEEEAGSDHGGMEEAYAEAKKALAHAREIYPDDKKEALKCATHHLKMSKHMEKKEEEEKAKEAASKDSGASDKEPAGKGDKPQVHNEGSKDDGSDHDSDGDGDSDGSDGKKKATKESATPKNSDQRIKELESENLKLSGELTSLKEEIKKIKLVGYLDKKLKESGLPNSATKAFREKLGKVPVLKNEKEVDDRIALFMEGRQSARKEMDTDYLGLGVEKDETNGSGSAGTLADCVD